MGRVYALLILVFALVAPARASEPTVILFAAASTTDAVTEVAQAYEAQGHGRVRTVFGSSATLARQIAHGAPADVYLSANTDWVDYLAARDAIAPDTRHTLLGNSLVLAVPHDSPLVADAESPFTNLLAHGRIALADPASVPAGQYAKQALSSVGQWSEASGHLVYAANVRAALKWIARGEVAGGIVYATDAAIEPTVRPIWTFPAASHTAIAYESVRTGAANNASADRLHAFLNGPDAMAIFTRHGFLLPLKDGG
jgi:molybdate transport system substrate-binding protein